MKQKLLFFLILLGILLVPNFGSSQNVFINEIHYDNAGDDVNELIEVAAPAGTDLTGWTVVFYNGNGGQTYETEDLTGVVTDSGSGFGFVTVAPSSIQNGAPDGIALVDASGTAIQFLSYEGSFVAVGGPADGMTSTNIGVEESSSTPANFSLQLGGLGAVYSDFGWQSEQVATFGSTNIGQTFGEPIATTSIAEVRELPEGTEVTISGTLTVSDQIGGPAFIQDETGGIAIFDSQIHGAGTYAIGDRMIVTAVTAAFNDQIQLSNVSEIQFLGAGTAIPTIIEISQFEAYRGQLVTVNAIDFADAGGVFSGNTNYAISDESGTADLRIDNDITGVAGLNIPESCMSITGVIGHFRGTNQLLVRNIGDFGCDLNSGPEPEPVNSTVFINEFHYDNGGTDTGEAIEIAGPVGTNLSEYSIVLYNGDNNQTYNSIVELEGYISHQQGGYGTSYISFPSNGLQNGSPDGIALVKGDEVIQFISYEGSFTAENGPAAGMTSTDIGVSENGGTLAGYSLQLIGSGTVYSDFEWESVAIPDTFGAVNTNQTFTGDPIVFINEIHYDNIGTDAGEGIEIAGIAGIDLSGFQLILYNGGNNSSYNTKNLSGIIPDQQKGYGTIFFSYPSNGLQNGGEDGIALISPEGKVIQFLSYEGSLTASNGPASGMTSVDIGVSESNNTTESETSLQLSGQGFVYSDFVWEGPVSSTYDQINVNQSFGEIIIPIEIISIAEARTKAVGEEVTIVGTLTVAGEFGNVAYIQDETGGIAIFDSQITEAGYEIGDKFQLTGEIGEYFGLLQLVDISSVTEMDSEGVMEPITITLDQLDDYRGQLVRVTDVSFEENAILYASTNYVISDATTSAELRIDNDLESLLFQQISGTCTEVIGVVGNYETTSQLQPRLEADVPCTETFVPTDPYASVSKNETLDMVTWNMEWFGDAGNAPAEGAVQKEAIKNALLELDADIIGVQEIVDTELFAEMVSELEGYDFILSDAVSKPNCNQNYDDAQRVGFIYKTSVISVESSKILLEEVHPYTNGCDESFIEGYPTGNAGSLWGSGRLPFMLQTTVTLNGESQDFDFVVIHAKSGSDSEDYYRRLYDNGVLKDTLDVYYPDSNLVLLGDYNDDVDETIASGTPEVSSYIEFLNDEDYWTVTSTLSEAGYRSTIFYNSVIDHITISDELFDNYLEGSETVHYEFYTPEYTSTASDHFPVSARLILFEEETVAKNNGKMVELCKNDRPLFVSEEAVESHLANGATLGSCAKSASIVASPNPVVNETVVSLSNFKNGQVFYTVYSLSGRVMESGKILVKEETVSFNLNMGSYLPGLYIIQARNGFGEIATTKVIKR